MKRTWFGFTGSGILLVLILAMWGSSATATATATSNTTDHSRMSMIHMSLSKATTTSSDPMTDSLKPLSGKAFEIKFLQYMIVHHQAADQMAQLISTHTAHPQLHALAQDIVRTQSSEITEMTTWLKQWYGAQPISNPTTVPGMTTMRYSMEHLKTLYGTAFDEQFLPLMIQHHQQAGNMSNLLPSKTQRPELLTLGQNIIKTQGAEIQQMQTWQKEWFDP